MNQKKRKREKKYSQQEFIESANVIAKTARIRKRKEMNAFRSSSKKLDAIFKLYK